MHWTYAEAGAGSGLEQGDLLAPTDELRGILKSVHPHFCDDKYLAFAIATQSCDLVRRKGTTKARYISIAAVRSLNAVLPRLLEQVAEPLGAGLFTASSRGAAREFLERLLDQNEQSLGLFYLHPDADVGLGEPAVVFLRVKVALRQEHYDVLLRARRGRLEAEFRGKFGWLLGNLYSRAASPDWSDSDGGTDKRKGLIDDLLQEKTPGQGPVWVDDDEVAAAREASVVFENRAQTDLLAEVRAHRPPPRIEQAAEIAVKELDRFFNPNDFVVKAMRKRLEEKVLATLHELGAITKESDVVQKALALVVDAAVEKVRSNPAVELANSLRTQAMTVLEQASMSPEQAGAVEAALTALIETAVNEVHPPDQLAKYGKKLANSGSLKKLLK